MSNPDAIPARYGTTTIPPFGCKPKTDFEMIREMLVKEALSFCDSGIFGQTQQPQEASAIQRA